MIKYIIFLSIISNYASAVDGGRKATKRDLNSLGTVAIVSKLSDGTMKPSCTGVRITPRHIVTADHCVGQNELKLPYISENSNPYDGPYEVVESVILFKRNYQYFSWDESITTPWSDIAILKLKKANNDAKIVNLGFLKSFEDNPEITQVGFGRNINLSDDATEEEWERSFKLPYYGTAHIREDLNYVLRKDNYYIYINTNKAGVQPGDSGGPLFTEVNGKYMWQGILSSAGETCSNGVCSRSAKYFHPQFYANWMACAVRKKDLWRGSYIGGHLQVPCGDSGELTEDKILLFYDKSCKEKFASEMSPLSGLDNIVIGFDPVQQSCAPMNESSCNEVDEVLQNDEELSYEWNTSIWNGTNCLVFGEN